MADVIHVQSFMAPWRPSEDAELVETFRYHEIPLEGIIWQHGMSFFFACISGWDEDYNIWAYLHVSDREVEQFGSMTAEDSRHFEFGDRPYVLAMARDGAGIVCSVVGDVLTREGVADALQRLEEAFHYELEQGDAALSETKPSLLVR